MVDEHGHLVAVPVPHPHGARPRSGPRAGRRPGVRDRDPEQLLARQWTGRRRVGPSACARPTDRLDLVAHERPGHRRARAGRLREHAAWRAASSCHALPMAGSLLRTAAGARRSSPQPQSWVLRWSPGQPLARTRTRVGDSGRVGAMDAEVGGMAPPPCRRRARADAARGGRRHLTRRPREVPLRLDPRRHRGHPAGRRPGRDDRARAGDPALGQRARHPRRAPGRGLGPERRSARRRRRHRALDRADAGHRDRHRQPGRRRRARRPQRRGQAGRRRRGPLVPAGPQLVRDLLDRRQHRDQRRGPVLREVRRHHRLRARPRRRARRRHPRHPRRQAGQGRRGPVPAQALRRLRGHPRRRHPGDPAPRARPRPPPRPSSPPSRPSPPRPPPSSSSAARCAPRSSS